MGFLVEQRERDGVPILALRGRLVLGESIETLRERLLALLKTSL